MMPDTSFATQKTMQSTVNSQPAADPYAKAAEKWFAGTAKRFEFAEEAAAVVGNFEEGATQGLADRIEYSVTTVQDHAKVGKLWVEVLKNYPSDAELLRADLQIGFWLPVARLWGNKTITLAGAFQWLKLARSRRQIEKRFTVEKFRNGLPKNKPSPDGEPEYAATMRQLVFKVQSLDATIEEAMHAPAFGVKETEYRELQAALRVVKDLAERVMRRSEVEAEGKSAE